MTKDTETFKDITKHSAFLPDKRGLSPAPERRQRNQALSSPSLQLLSQSTKANRSPTTLPGSQMPLLCWKTSGLAAGDDTKRQKRARTSQNHITTEVLRLAEPSAGNLVPPCQPPTIGNSVIITLSIISSKKPKGFKKPGWREAAPAPS